MNLYYEFTNQMYHNIELSFNQCNTRFVRRIMFQYKSSENITS